MKKHILLLCLISFFSNTIGFSQGIYNLSSGKMFADACGLSLPWSDKTAKIYLAKDGAFVLETRRSHICAFGLHINEVEDYTIEATVQKLSLSTYSFGIVLGFKDWDNYTLLSINSGRGEYSFSSRVNGIWVDHVDWTYSTSVNLMKKRNHIKIWKHGNNFILAINGVHVGTTEAFGLLGEGFGFYVNGEGKYALHNFKIVSEKQPKRDTSTETTSNNNSGNQMQIVGSGTGFAIDNRGYFVTNHHVIDGAGAIGICLQKNGEWVSYDGKVIKTDPTNDIAIIKIDDDNFNGFNNIPYSFSYESEDVASDIFTLGYPRVDVMGTDIKYTTGVINSRTGIQGDPTHYQISAHIDHGNSGGPLFNAKGQIIGITDSGLDKAEFGDVNYSVKSMYIKALVESLPMKLQLPNDSRITTMSRSEQIKTISPYVALILIAQ